jgi:hypothetical protein
MPSCPGSSPAVCDPVHNRHKKVVASPSHTDSRRSGIIALHVLDGPTAAKPLQIRFPPSRRAARASEPSTLRIDSRSRAGVVTLIGYVKTEDTLICGRFLLCCGDDRRR